MAETSKETIQLRPPPSGETWKGTRGQELRFSSPTFGHLQTPDPTSRLSPQNNNGGSVLYDSYELRALTYQLNKAMMHHRSSSGSSSPGYLCHLKSPFYRYSQCLDHVNKAANSRAAKRVLCSHLTCATINRNAAANASNRRSKEVTSGFAVKLWNNVKQGLARSNNKLRE